MVGLFFDSLRPHAMWGKKLGQWQDLIDVGWSPDTALHIDDEHIPVQGDVDPEVNAERAPAVLDIEWDLLENLEGLVVHQRHRFQFNTVDIILVLIFSEVVRI